MGELYSYIVEVVQSHYDNACWVWTGATSNGYGQVRRNGKLINVAVAAYEVRYGPIPAGLEIDHLCRNRPCWNPKHLEAVTHHENILRAVPYLYNTKKTQCPKGHPYDESNTGYYKGSRNRRLQRYCLTCHREKQREYRQRKAIVT